MAGIVICIFICKAAFDIFRSAISKMVDHSCDEAVIKNIKMWVKETQGVMRIDVVKTRLFGDKIYVDIEISVDGTLPLYAAHDIAEHVHDKIEQKQPDVKHCMVHVNPWIKS